MYTIKIASGAEQIDAISFSPIKKRPSRESSKLETAAGRPADQKTSVAQVKCNACAAVAQIICTGHSLARTLGQ
jgi:hypothetical protein